MAKKPTARALAALVISKLVTRKLTLTVILPDYLARLTDKKDQSFLQELCYGVIRHYYLLEFILDNLLEKPLKSKDSDIKALLMAGLYQEIFLRTPPHATVSATVDACVELNKPWAKNLVNALLRRLQRESEYLLPKADCNLSTRYSHPDWLLDILRRDYPESWQNICEHNNQRPPMYLRVNTQKITRNSYLDLLEQAGISASSTRYSQAGIKLVEPVNVQELPEFDHGFVSVQELAAQFTPELLDIMPGLRVLDACSAPGGKLAHILEYEPELKEVVAIEKDAFRYERVKQTLKRLQLEACLINADARNIDVWWNGEKFDRILLDAPCSATGVIRRHPDIKVLRTPEEIKTVRALQHELLNVLWPLLNTGGKLLYVTCSILNDENDIQIENFIQQHNDTKIIGVNVNWGTSTKFGKQILPGQDDMDGFYYACLQKI